MRFPTASLLQIRNVVSAESPRQHMVDLLARANMGQFARATTVFNCPPGTSVVRMGLRVTVFSPKTGLNKAFSWSTDVPSSGRLRDIIRATLSETESVAVSKGYQIYNVQASQRGQPIGYTIDFVECY